MKHAAFQGRLVMLGFGSIGAGVLPLILRHIDMPKDRIEILTADDRGVAIAAEYGIKHTVLPLTRENYATVLRGRLSKGDFLLNLSVDVSSVALVTLCREIGALYLDTCVEPWVGGYTDPQGSRVGLGALLVGFYDGDDLVYAGKIGTGFDTKMLLDLRRRFDAIGIAKSPFTRAVGLPRLRTHWVKPRIVVQVSFIEWTANDKLRHPRLIGIRFDKDPADVVKEQA